jgi:hypothetical protein
VEYQTLGGQDSGTNMVVIIILILNNSNEAKKSGYLAWCGNILRIFQTSCHVNCLQTIQFSRKFLIGIVLHAKPPPLPRLTLKLYSHTHTHARLHVIKIWHVIKLYSLLKLPMAGTNTHSPLVLEL